MISLQIYPVMDGLEVWASATCSNAEHRLAGKKPGREAFYVDRERLDKHGPEVVLGSELTVLLYEFPELATHLFC